MSNSQPIKHTWDAVVIGSGAGGAAAAYQLATNGLRVLILEKGVPLPRDGSTLDIDRVVHQGEFVSHELWATAEGSPLAPEEHFNLGGKTKWYGAALVRFSPGEFSGDSRYGARGWPIPYEVLAPYYEQAERLLGVRHFPCEDNLGRILAKLARVESRWQSTPIPLALSQKILANPIEAAHFDGFASVADLKGDAEVSFLSHLRSLNVELRTHAEVLDLLPGASPGTVDGVLLANGEEIRAKTVLLAAGALHSPRLLGRYVRRNMPSLPAGRNIGRFLKLHLLTALIALSPSRKADLLRKTMITVNEAFPHSSLQPLGFDGQLIATLVPAFVPRFLARQIGLRAYGFFLQTEDGSSQENCVRESTDEYGSPPTPVLDYDETRTPEATAEHKKFVRAFRSSLLRIYMPSFTQRIGLTGTAHACGTLITGSSPEEAVVDSRGAVFGLNGLYVVDGSILPRMSRVNPALSIYAWGLRAGELLSRDLKREISTADGSRRSAS